MINIFDLTNAFGIDGITRRSNARDAQKIEVRQIELVISCDSANNGATSSRSPSCESYNVRPGSQSESPAQEDEAIQD